MRRILVLLILWAAPSLAQVNQQLSVAPEVVELTRRGDEQLAVGLAVQAVPLYLEALAIDRDHADAAFGLGVAYLQLATLSEALYAFDRVIDLDPERFEAHFNRALVLARLGRHDEAALGFERALELPSDPSRRRAAYVALGTQRWWAQDASAAADAYAALAVAAPWLDAIPRSLDLPPPVPLADALMPDSGDTLTHDPEVHTFKNALRVGAGHFGDLGLEGACHAALMALARTRGQLRLRGAL
jgi:tetratricopeptide (TPR) repeat protein